MQKTFTLLVGILLCSVLAFAQTTVITGTVRDGSGDQIPGVAIRIKGTSEGVSTDVTGGFKISVPPNAILTFSAIGYDKLELPVGNLKTMSVTLKSSNTALTEVVVTALGVKREREC